MRKQSFMLVEVLLVAAVVLAGFSEQNPERYIFQKGRVRVEFTRGNNVLPKEFSFFVTRSVDRLGLERAGHFDSVWNMVCTVEVSMSVTAAEAGTISCRDAVGMDSRRSYADTFTSFDGFASSLSAYFIQAESVPVRQT